MRQFIIAVVLTAGALCGGEACAQRPGFGFLYYENEVVRTVVPPASVPNQGRDALFVVTNGVELQLAIASVAPGDRDYHGGDWKVYTVTFVVEPMLLTSATDVELACMLGLVDVQRIPEADFKCPIQFLPRGKGN